MPTAFWFGSLKGRYLPEDIDVDGQVNIKMDLEIGSRVWIGSIWLRIKKTTGGGLL
jgi:hypothetical protein